MYLATKLLSYSQQLIIVRSVKQRKMFSVNDNVHLGCWHGGHKIELSVKWLNLLVKIAHFMLNFVQERKPTAISSTLH